PCSENPCLNGGTCNVDKNSFQCKCPSFFSGNTCEKECNCGAQSKSCRFGLLGKICECEDGYSDRNGICTEICFGDEDCTKGTVCTRIEKGKHFCECPPNFRGDMCEINMLCEKLLDTCDAMAAVCVMRESEAYCACPAGKKVDLQSGLCKDICDPGKCLNGICEVVELDYRCRCEEGYTGLRCEEKVTTTSNNLILWVATLISVNAFIGILLFGILCLLCCRRN
ncbi:hypothetical protein NPIL_296091, partial [Nephila pilipes]